MFIYHKSIDFTMNSIEELVKKNGFTMEEVQKYAQEKYPQFASNISLVAKLFLIQKGINLSPPQRLKGNKVKINQLQPNENAIVDVVLVQEIETRSYIGCPICFKKLPVLGETECPKDGIVISENLQWRTFLTGDDTGEMIVTFAPTIKETLTIGSTITIRGAMSEKNGEFTAFNVVTGNESVQEVPKQITPANVEGIKCPICGKIFRQETGLKVHMKLVHKQEYKGQEEINDTKVTKVPETTNTTTTAGPSSGVAPTENTNPPHTNPPEPTPSQEIRPEAVRLAKVYGLLKKPLKDFQDKLDKDFPNTPLDEVLKLASVKIDHDNKLYVEQ